MWALGLFAAGQAATMVCTYAGQIIMGGTLEVQLAPWVRVAITRVFALGPALIVAVSTSGNEKLFNNINEYLNILQSIQLPFAMLPVLHFSAQKHLLGRFRSGQVATAITSGLALGVIGVSVYLIVLFIQDPSLGFTTPSIVCVCLYGLVYFGFCIRMMWDEVVQLPNFFLSLVGLGSQEELQRGSSINGEVTVHPLPTDQGGSLARHEGKA